ncbi:MAG: Fe-S cluster assembly protein SufD [Alphaproteobacteria bacterium]|nr:Fe-S cluster assembly protein SufD [Alphaproteobacteria bacterium]
MSIALQPTAAEQAFGMSLPHRRMEEWRWTDLRARLDKPYPSIDTAVDEKSVARIMAASPLAGIAKYRAVFVNGKFDATNSTIPALLPSVIPAQAGIHLSIKENRVQSDSRLRGNDDGVDDPLVVLNTSLKPEGVTLHFSSNITVLVEIMHIATNAAPRAVALRNHIEVAAGASATIIETFIGEGDYVLSSVTELELGEGARLDRIKLEWESAKANHLSQVVATLAKDARLNEFTLTSGAALNRQNGTYTFVGQNADAKISGAYLLNGKQHADTCLVVDHKVPHCTSRELFKCVMDDHARGIFQGKVIVRKHAQKTDGKQSSHALLLSETAEFDAKPELEIYADDVVCGHGATSGDINPDHLFYLRSRGIPEAEAKSLLIAAFVGEAFDNVENDDVRAALVNFAEDWLRQK